MPEPLTPSLTILIADDDAPYRETLAQLLGKSGFKVMEAKSGNEAFSIIQAQPIDVLLTDLRMNDGTGIELMRKVRRHRNTLQKVPRIIVNTGLLEGGENYLEALGAAHIFVKPMSYKDLLEAILT